MQSVAGDFIGDPASVARNLTSPTTWGKRVPSLPVAHFGSPMIEGFPHELLIFRSSRARVIHRSPVDQLLCTTTVIDGCNTEQDRLRKLIRWTYYSDFPSTTITAALAVLGVSVHVMYDRLREG